MVKRLAWIGIWTLLMIGCTLVDNPDTPTPMPDPTEESETGIEIDESTPSVSESIDYQTAPRSAACSDWSRATALFPIPR